MNVSLYLFRSGVLVGIGMLLGVGLLMSGYLLGVSSMIVFCIPYAAVTLMFPPRKLVSPLTIIQAYYFVWFILAPAFAELHSQDDFADVPHYLAYGMLFLTYTTAVFGARIGEWAASRSTAASVPAPLVMSARDIRLKAITGLLYVTSTFLVVMIVLASGGFARWIEAPGDAFLNREGSGVYVVLSHFITFCLSALVGYRSYTSRRRLPLFMFIAWLAVTSPVHGSKALISLFLILSLTPWLRNLKVAGLSSVVFVATLVFIFFFGLYLRNISWITVDEAIPYALNYFTTLRNLVMLIEDFKPDLLTTFFLPFNKFLTPFGLTDPTLYFDMNHMLTDKYFPTAWEIRATEQWPVEADLYLNFYFVFGLPLVFLYTYIVGRIYGQAKATNNLGSWIVAMLLSISIVSHLRGSLINHLDFYLYPMFIVIYALLRRRSFNDRIH